MSAPITDYVNLTISTATRAISQASLETPILIGYHTRFADRVREYASIAGLEADGFVSTDPIHKMATALLSSERRVERFKVGRRALAPVQSIDLTPTTDVITATVSVTIRFLGLTETHNLVGLGTGIPAMATALAALINAGIFANGGTNPDYIVAAGVGSVVQIRQGASHIDGQLFYFDDLANLTLDDSTADPGIATDITAIRAEDDDWYCALLDSSGGAENVAFAVVFESTAPDYKICLVATQDSDVPADTAGNIGETLHDANRHRVAPFYSPFGMDQYPACVWAGERLPYKPSQSTWMFKVLAGVDPVTSQLSAGQITALEGNGVNCYVYAAGRGDTRKGTMADGTFIDDRHLLDYLAFRIPEEIMAVFRNPLTKVPYTDRAAKVVRGLIYKVCARCEKWGALALTDEETGKPTFSFRATTKAADQETADIAARVFRGLEWTVLRTSAVHKFYINGTLTDASGA